MYGFYLITSDTEKEVQGDFPQAADMERDSGRIPHLFLQGWLNLSINLPEWAIEGEGCCLGLFSIYQICPLVPSS